MFLMDVWPCIGNYGRIVAFKVCCIVSTLGGLILAIFTKVMIRSECYLMTYNGVCGGCKVNVQL